MKTVWQTKKLGDVIDKVVYTKKIHRKRFLLSGKFPVVSQEQDFINGYWNNERDVFRVKKPISIFGDHTQILKYIDFDFVLGADGVKILQPKNILDSKYFYYSLQNLNLRSLGYARHFRLLKDADIAYPESLDEQKRIVKLLDEVFEKVTKVKNNMEKNLQNSKELFESYSQSIFTNPREDWEMKKLGDVCNIIGGGTPAKANHKFYGGDIPWATVRDMKSEIIKDTEHKITKDAVRNSSTNIIPKKNVVIATRVGLGKVCLIEHDTAINQDLRGVVPINPRALSVDYLYRWFKSISHKIVGEGTGATVQGVKLPFIKSLVIVIPTLTEQKTIVKKLDALSVRTKKLEKIYKQNLADLEELKKSVLQKAFAGEL